MKKDDGYVMIPNALIRSENLSVYEKVLFAVLLSYNGNEDVFPGYETLIKQTGIKRTKLAWTIKSLREKRYIEVLKDPHHNTNTYRILKKGLVRNANDVVRETDCAVREANGESSSDERGVVREAASNNKSINIKRLIKDNVVQEEEPCTDVKAKEADNIPYKEIIDYLNVSTGKKYMHTGKSTQRHIKARWNEGYGIDDFKGVIKNMTGKWLSDPKMCDYLRPETLFGTKFDGYLNSTPSVSSQQGESDYPFKRIRGVQ